MKRELQRKMSFVLFVMAVFYAGMALTVFQEYIWMACIAGILLLATSVFYVLSPKEENQSPTEKTTELLLADRMAELMRGSEKAEKGVYIAVKKQHEAMESGLTALEEKITELIKAQENAVKTLVMYNKENAKQMALSEREELRRLGEELKQFKPDGEDAGSQAFVAEAVKEMSRRLYEEFHENGEAMLSELGTTVDSLEEIKEMLRQLSENRPMPTEYHVPVEPVSTAVAESVAQEEPVVISEPEVVEKPVVMEEPESPKDTLASSGVDLSDPNKTLSADDIAALFAQADTATAEESKVTEEPVVISESEEDSDGEESPAEGKPEDAITSSGVDLSDPNKTLSADDIAALFASMGN